MTGLRRLAVASLGWAAVAGPAVAADGWTSAAHPGEVMIGAAQDGGGAAAVLHADPAGAALLSRRPARGPWLAPRPAIAPAGVRPLVSGADGRGGLLVLGPTADGAAVASSTLRDGLWTAPRQVLPAGATPLRVAANDRGDAAAVARTADGLALVARDAGPNWDEPTGIPLPAPADAHPALALSRQGQAVAVWVEGDEYPRLMASGRRPGGVWSAPAPLVLTDPAPIDHLAVAVDDDGVATVLWRAGGGATATIQAARLRPLAHWSAVERLPDSAGGRAPAVAVDGAGTAVAAWGREDGAGIQTAERAADGDGWRRARMLGGAAGAPAQAPRLAVNILGQGVVAWAGGRIARRGPAGGWSAPQAALPVTETGIATAAHLSRAGDTLLAWGDAGTTVMGTRRGAGNTAIRALRVLRTPTSGARAERRVRVRVRANVAGPALITLRRNRDGRTLWATTVRLTRGWSTHTAPAGVATTPARGRHTVTVLGNHRTTSHARRTAVLP